LGEIDLAIAALADLGEDLEIALTEAGATLAKVCALATEVFEECGLVFFVRCGWGVGVGGFELGVAGLAVVDVAEKVKVVVEEVWGLLEGSILLGRGVDCSQSCVTFTRRLTFGCASFSISSGVRPRIWTWRFVVSSRC
jgi:hypothetical protein